MSDRILRLQHVEVRVPDLELCTAYYTEVLGLIETARTENQVFLKCWDEREHHSVILREAPTYGLDHMSFKVGDAADLDYFTEKLQAVSVPVKRYAARELGPGWGEAIRFDAPSGHVVELTHGTERVGNMLPMTNPPPRPQDLVGIAPPRLDHVFVMAEDVEAFTTVLRRRAGVPPHRADPGQRRAPARHVPRAQPHPARHRRDHRPERRAAPLRVLGRRLERHPRRRRHAAPTTAWRSTSRPRGTASPAATRTYFFDPVGNRNELFTGGYWVDPDFEPITWTEEEMGRAIFYYDRQVNERFFTVHS